MTKIWLVIFMVSVLIVGCIRGDGITHVISLERVPPPAFEVISVGFTLSAGRVVEIRARVKNVGGAEGSHAVTLKVDGNDIATKTIVVDSGNTETLSFGCSVSTSGDHIVEVGKLAVPIDRLTAVMYADPQDVVVTSTQSFVDILQPCQIIDLLPLTLDEVSQDTATITHNHVWLFDGIKWLWELQVPTSLYNYFRGLQRPSTNDYSIYVTHPVDNTYIDKLVAELERAAQEQDFDTRKTIEFVVAFTQCLPHTSDLVTTDYSNYPRYPIETLADFGGDCEDTAILLAALLIRMGQDVVLVAFPNHYGVGILADESTYGTYWKHNGGEYFYVETSTIGWKIGEIPEDLTDVPATIIAVD